MNDIREDWEKEMYDDDQPSVEFAGVFVLFVIMLLVFLTGVFVGAWMW